MRTFRKEFLIAVLTVVLVGGLSSTYAVGAKKPRKASQKSEYLDLYVRQGPKTFRLHQGDLIFKTALSLGPDKSGLYGIPSPPGIRLDIKPIEIMVFDPEGAGQTMRLAKLGRVETAQAHSFDFQVPKVGPTVFENIYHVNYDASLPINLWCVEKNIHLQLSPVAGKPGWYCAVPEQELEAGIYAVDFGCVDGPRVYIGDLYFYPFNLAEAPPPPVCKPVRRSKRRRAPECPPVVACPPTPQVHAPTPVPPPAARQMDAAFDYVAVSPKGRREYRITNTNDIPWHNVNISVFIRDSRFPATVLGPVTLYKDIVLPDHTVSQVPDKTLLQYETIGDEGAKLYLKVKCKEGVIKKAWQNVYIGESGQADLIEVPWDLKE